MKTDRVVLDVNILISLILNRQVDKLVEWYKDYNITIYLCPELLAELKEVLNRPKIKGKLKQSPSLWIDFIKSVGTGVEIDKRFDRAPDLKDNYLFDLAYSVKAYYIVTGDHPLLNMKHINRIKIISLIQWQNLLRQA